MDSSADGRARRPTFKVDRDPGRRSGRSSHSRRPVLSGDFHTIDLDDVALLKDPEKAAEVEQEREMKRYFTIWR